MSRLFRLVSVFAICLASALGPGCIESDQSEHEVEIWGRRGIEDGRFQKPRAIAVDASNHLYIVDMTGRIQVFDEKFNLVNAWRTPEIRMGKPCGMTVANDGTLMVADTHYHRILFYDIQGNLDESRTIGGR
ncbi:MAG: hypothetical protein AAGA30_12175, partial [Planctomycetota bacterium]